MSRIGIVWGGLVTAMAVALAVNSAVAWSATSEQVGKPLALLAGLRPPHESKHSVHAKTAHATIERTAAKKTRRARMAAAHTRHIAAGKTAKTGHKPRERAVTASAFAEEPPAKTTPNPASGRDWPVANPAPTANSAAAPATDTIIAPVSENTSNLDASANPSAVQTVKITPPDQITSTDRVNALAPTANHIAPTAATPNDHPVVAPSQQAALAVPAHQDASAVGSASWIAQVLAALGGAVAAGAVAWFLIGGAPVRTYG